MNGANRRCPLVVLIALVGVVGPLGEAWAAAFGKRMSITIDRTKVGITSTSTLSNYPVLFNTTNANLKTGGGGSVTSASGYDIVFRGLDTATCADASKTACTLSHEVERYTGSSGELISWVKVPSLNGQAASSNTVIYVYYGNSSITSSSERVTDVWDSNFKGVWHLRETTGGANAIKDSTSNANHGTDTGSVTLGATGKMGYGITLPGGTGHYISKSSPNGAGITGDITMSAWMTMDSVSGDRPLFAKTDGGSAFDYEIWFNNTGSEPHFYSTGTSPGSDAICAFGTSTGAWHHLAVTRSSGTATFYIDGVSTSSVSKSGNFQNNSVPLYIGAEASNGSWYGSMDEMRLSSVDLGPGWIATEYNNQSSPSSFYSLGSQVSSPATSIRLREFNARRTPEGVELAWRTGYEVDNLGFHVHRESAGGSVRVTPSLVAGSALFAGMGTALTAGRRYVWQDQSLQAGSSFRYWLEEVALDGKSTFHGPIAPAPAHDKGPPRLAVTRPALLGGLGQGGAARAEQRRVPWHEPTPTKLAGQSDGPAWLKVKVRDEGWYRLGRTELEAAGFSLDPQALRLYAGGEPQALSVTNDGLEFYGLGIDSPWSDERVYQLFSGASAGEAPRVVPTMDARGVSDATEMSFPFTLVRQEKSIYFAALKNGDAENFFGPTITSKPAEISFFVRDLATSTTPASLEVTLQGVTDVSHQVKVALNGADIGAVSFEGQTQGVLKSPLPAGVLAEGDNKVTLVSAGGDRDVTLGHVVRLIYPRKYRAVDDVARFSLPMATTVTVRGFSGPDIRAVDVTDPRSPVELAGMVAGDGAGYSIALTVQNGADRVLAFTRDQTRTPVSIERRSIGKADPGRADLVILSHADFLGALQPLVERRRRQGLVVRLVDVESAYDELSFGQKSPFAIRGFLEKAKRESGARYALLVGDATFDPRNYLGMGAFDFVPTKLVDTLLLETASDDWMVDFDGDLVPDLALGRLPVRTVEDTALIVEKLVAYGPPRPTSVVVVAGEGTDTDFAGEGRRLLAALPVETKGKLLAVDSLGVERARTDLLTSLRGEAGIVEYLGHGSAELWAGGLFGRDDATSLDTGRPAIFAPLTCLNGFFHDVYTESLAEALLKAPRGGAVAVWASSGLTYPDDQFPLGEHLIGALLRDSATLGEAAVVAKAHVGDDDVRRTWVLLGDPTLRVSEPSGASETFKIGCACTLGSPRARPAVPGIFWGILAGVAVLVLGPRGGDNSPTTTRRNRRNSPARPP